MEIWNCRRERAIDSLICEGQWAGLFLLNVKGACNLCMMSLDNKAVNVDFLELLLNEMSND